MVFMSEPSGYRGYIGSRPYFGQSPPQHVQNLVIRDFCRRKGFDFLLSATEYAMPGCHMMLNQVLAELPSLQGVVLYSLFMLPRDTERRRAVYRRVLDAGASLHGAVEGQSILSAADAARVEDIWLVRLALPQCPTHL
jgi:sporadic carbohydrate cluster protein (TIGR04323 family)